MNIFGKMSQSEYFSNSEKVVIDYLLTNSSDLKTLTVKELAQKSFTSSSTIIRLYQKLGCSTYNEFKIQFYSELSESITSHHQVDFNLPFSSKDSFNAVTHNLGQLYNSSISDTLSLVDQASYQNAIDILSSADFIDIYGTGANQSIAHDFKLNMMRIGKQVTTHFDAQQLKVTAAYSNKKRASLIISYTGETEDVVGYCKVLKATNSPMICITNTSRNTISELCDTHLYITTKENMFKKIGMFSTKISIILILDILYSGIFKKDYEQNMELIIEKRKITTDAYKDLPDLY